ncbi:MAG: LysR family transcriptional regulator [Cocleimonas sp.]
MHITIRQLQIIEAIVQTHSYSLAAERLYMTQPAISMQIKQLEHNIGVKLFERQGKRIVLSSAGQDIHPQIQRLITNYDDLLGDIKDTKDLHKGRIKVSATTTANHLVTQMIAQFSKTNKNITVTLKITNRQTLIKQLQDFEPDIVIMGEPPTKLDVIAERLIPNSFVAIAAPEHHLAKKKNITLAEIADEDLILRESGSGTRAVIESHFKSNNIDFNSSLEMGSNESIKHAVSAGLGIGAVSMHSILLELEANRLVILDVEDFPINNYWHIIKRKGKHLHPAAKQFQDFIVKESVLYMDSYKQFID